MRLCWMPPGPANSVCVIAPQQTLGRRSTIQFRPGTSHAPHRGICDHNRSCPWCQPCDGLPRAGRGRALGGQIHIAFWLVCVVHHPREMCPPSSAILLTAHGYSDHPETLRHRYLGVPQQRVWTDTSCKSGPPSTAKSSRHFSNSIRRVDLDRAAAVAQVVVHSAIATNTGVPKNTAMILPCHWI
jgi:hypothetical protein